MSGRIKGTGPYVLGGSTMVLEQFEKLSCLIPSTAVQPAVKLTLSILDVVQTMHDNREKYQELLTNLGRLMVVVLKPWTRAELEDVPRRLQDSLANLLKWLQDIEYNLHDLQRAGRVNKVVMAKERAKKLTECNDLLSKALAFFHVETEIDSALATSDLQNQLATMSLTVDGVGEDVRYIRKAITGHAPSSKSVMMHSMLPSRPEILFGRDADIAGIVARLCNTNNVRLCVVGPGGIGKTTVVLGVAHDPEVTKKYGSQIIWVSCTEATSPQLIEDHIADSLGLADGLSKSSRRSKMRSALMASEGQWLFLIDNFETVWDDTERQLAAEDLLQSLASVGSVSLVLTMRGNVPPSTGRMRWTKPYLKQLPTLSLTAARELYLEENEKSENDEDLDDLLEDLSFMPLAVRLMARRARASDETAQDLHTVWKSRDTHRMLHQGNDRLHSINLSVELSVQSNLVQQNPDTLVVLQMLAHLPGGMDHHDIGEYCPLHIKDHDGAISPLLMSALAQKDDETGRITMLEPVRVYIAHTYPASPELLNRMLAQYTSLLRRHPCTIGRSTFHENMKIIGNEEANLYELLDRALASRPPNPMVIQAAYAFSDYLYHSQNDLSQLEIAVKFASHISDQRRDSILAKGLALLCQRKLAVHLPQSAADAGNEALGLYTALGDQVGRFRCFSLLSHAFGQLMLFKMQVSAAEESLHLAREIGKKELLPVAFRAVAYAYENTDRMEEGIALHQKSIDLHEELGNTLEVAKGYTHLQIAFTKLGDLEEARIAGELALANYRDLRLDENIAGTLESLSNLYRRSERYWAALVAVRKARDLFARAGCDEDVEHCERVIGGMEEDTAAREAEVKVHGSLMNLAHIVMLK